MVLLGLGVSDSLSDCRRFWSLQFSIGFLRVVLASGVFRSFGDVLFLWACLGVSEFRFSRAVWGFMGLNLWVQGVRSRMLSLELGVLGCLRGG